MEIIMGLFGTLMPFDDLTTFYHFFVEQGWVFFNQLLLATLTLLKEQIMSLEEAADVI